MFNHNLRLSLQEDVSMYSFSLKNKNTRKSIKGRGVQLMKNLFLLNKKVETVENKEYAILYTKVFTLSSFTKIITKE